MASFLIVENAPLATTYLDGINDAYDNTCNSCYGRGVFF